MFGLFRALKRRRLRSRPFPPSWLPHLEARVPFFSELAPPDREYFLELLKVFVWEKHFIPANEMMITDEVKVVIGAAAVRLVLRLDLSYYNRLTEIIVYPDHFVDSERDGVIFGEAQDWGTVALSWRAVVDGLKNPDDGHDTATHEFAHVLDRADGAFDGTPELRAMGHYAPWARVMSENFLALRAGKRRLRRVVRNYGAQNEAEFFAVATEAFYEKPEQMKKRTPELYEELSRFFGVDPAGDDG
jgi:Mlc titration factor MtfA (ptsG expression regulator)